MYVPDYSNCTLQELYDVKCHIDKQQYPERYQDLLGHIARLERRSTSHPNGLCELCGSPLEERYGSLKLSSGESKALVIAMDLAMTIVAVMLCVIFSMAPFTLPKWLIAGIPGVFCLAVVMVLQRKREYLACTSCGRPYQVS